MLSHFVAIAGALTVIPLHALSEPCLMLCKDNYMHRLQLAIPIDDTSREWSICLVTPLQQIFRGQGRRGVRTRMVEICNHHDTFLDCLSRCNASKAREWLELGQESWRALCGAFKSDRRFANRILPCLAELNADISSSCSAQSGAVRHTFVELVKAKVLGNLIEGDLADLCGSIAEYDECYVHKAYERCGKESMNLLLEFSSSSTIVIGMIREWAALARLPEKCLPLASTSEYASWHSEKIEAEEEFNRLIAQVNAEASSFSPPYAKDNLLLILPIFALSATMFIAHTTGISI